MKVPGWLTRICLGLVLVAAFSGAPYLSANAQAVLRLAHNKAWSNPALEIGLSNGAFEKEGVKVKATEFSNPADMITAIVSGSIDAATVPSTVFAIAREKGVKIKAVALIQGNNRPPIAYTVLADSNIRTAADLRGKKVAVNNYGGNYDLILRAWLDQHHVDPKDVKIVVVPVPAMLGALIHHQVDMVPLAAVEQGHVKLLYPGKTRKLFDYGDVYRAATGANKNNSIILVVSQNFINKSRPTLVDFLRGYLKVVRKMNANPKVALKDWANAVDNKSILLLAAPPAIPNDGKIYTKAIKFETAMALKYGYLKNPIDILAYVDNSEIEEAAKSLK